MLKMVQTDSRVKLTNEVLTGINIIKFYTWVRPPPPPSFNLMWGAVLYLKPDRFTKTGSGHTPGKALKTR
jgi:hypothetical protein